MVIFTDGERRNLSPRLTANIAAWSDERCAKINVTVEHPVPPLISAACSWWVSFANLSVYPFPRER